MVKIAEPQPSRGSDSAFCSCGHDITEHHRGRCWIGVDGEPVRRSKAIECLCTAYERTTTP